MDITEILSLLFGFIGTGIAIYQWAVLNESKKRNKEIQYLLAGVSNLSLAKQQAWINQISFLNTPDDPEQLAHARSCVRARDDLGEVHSLVSALEGVIDADNSATTSILKKSLEQAKINNQLQEESLKNPTLSHNQKRNEQPLVEVPEH
jgi:hypothetical protein